MSQPRARGGERAVPGARTRGDAPAACGRPAPRRARAGVRACARAWESGGGGAGAGRALPGLGRPGGGGAGRGGAGWLDPEVPDLQAFCFPPPSPPGSPESPGAWARNGRKRRERRREGWKERGKFGGVEKITSNFLSCLNFLNLFQAVQYAVSHLFDVALAPVYAHYVSMEVILDVVCTYFKQ